MTARLDKTPGSIHLKGVVHIDNHQGASINGEFRPDAGGPASKLIKGNCHPIPGPRRALSFHFTLGGVTFAFRGIIDPASAPDSILCGSLVIVKGPPDVGDTGTWEATRGGIDLGGSGGSKKGASKGSTLATKAAAKKGRK